MIDSFGDKRTADLFPGRSTKRVRSLPPDVERVALRKLDTIVAAHVLEDLRSPPGNRLEALRGDLAGRHSIRINDQWRTVFRWSDGSASEVRIADYHR